MSAYIIAEAGVNHNGDLDIARQMVAAAAKAGANAIKFQTFKAENLVTQTAPQAAYQSENIGKTQNQYDMLKALELSQDDHHALIEECKNQNIDFLSSAFDITDAAFLIHECNQKTIKLGSGELTNAPLLLYIAEQGASVILSTGMSTMNEVKQALDVFERVYKENIQDKVSILQCTSAYPCLPEHANLRAMNTLRDTFDLPTGFSDHTTGIHIALAAVAMGAQILEKHFTLGRTMEGPDHKASLEPDELAAMIVQIRDVEVAFGHGERKPYPTEDDTKIVARKSIVAKIAIKKGEELTAENITTKRPENGLSPFQYWDVLGTKAVKDFKPDEAIIL